MLITFSELWITPLFCRKLSTFIHKNICLCGLLVYPKTAIIYRDRQNAERIFSRQAFMTCFGKIFYLYFHSHFIKTISIKNRQQKNDCSDEFRKQKKTTKVNSTKSVFYLILPLPSYTNLLNYYKRFYYIRFSPI